MPTHIHPVNVKLPKSRSEYIKNKLNTCIQKNQQTDVYLHQRQNGQHSVGLMYSQGKEVYYTDGQAMDFKIAFCQALFNLKQQFQEK